MRQQSAIHPGTGARRGNWHAINDSAESVANLIFPGGWRDGFGTVFSILTMQPRFIHTGCSLYKVPTRL